MRLISLQAVYIDPPEMRKNVDIEDEYFYKLQYDMEYEKWSNNKYRTIRESYGEKESQDLTLEEIATYKKTINEKAEKYNLNSKIVEEKERIEMEEHLQEWRRKVEAEQRQEEMKRKEIQKKENEERNLLSRFDQIQ